MKRILDKINFRQPKYMLPAILYIPLLGASYFIFDLFNTEKAEITDKTLQTTEFLNPNIPDATIRHGDGIGSKYENMEKSWGKIADYTAIDNIERDEPDEEKEKYESQYSSDEVALLGELEQQKALAEEEAAAKAREEEALKELERALAEARLKGQAQVSPILEDNPIQLADTSNTVSNIVNGTIDEDSRAVNAPSETSEPNVMVKKVKVPSDYFNTLTQNEQEANLIKAIIDEDIKAVDGSRVRLRLLDDVEINGTVVENGTYLYATMSGFGSQRVKGTINSVLVNDEIIKVNLSIYDTDGLEGLYVPSSSFRETAKDVASGAVGSNMSFNNGTAGSSLTQWGMQAIQNAYQKTSNAVSKAIRKNKVKLKYGTFVYIINDKEANKSSKQ
ncbi:conjugative transposon protein TraM [Butyricimonas virosa]|uniref:Conjugative transposon protein TraM n=1 Tax=Butyricimonas virosa TaxID=544645 RepID=A0ABX7H0Z3_9BACT|nr:conjugative transposon protein TraM [Butyricimonas virosa]QRO48551.1 conjugative transposon protein TraM [Butyricimonas virosa]UWO47083.1 conjugative transposon protein TraM [Butyricimonas virosa]